jgi:PAS domain S-box-containing protein
VTSSTPLIEEVAGATPDPIVVCDETGQITFANESALRLFGFTHSPIGQPVSILMPERLRPYHERSFCRFRDTGSAAMVGRVVSAIGLHRDGHEFPVNIALNGWRCDEGNLFVVAVIKDISATADARDHVKAIAEGRDG